MMSGQIFELRGKRVWVAGHRGMAGSALVRRLQSEKCEVVTVSHGEVDLRRQAETEDWLSSARIDAVFVAAAKVGGILANDTRPAEFLYDNLTIETNIIHGAYKARVKKLMLLGSSCIYPRMAGQPIEEEALLSGALEPTNEWYAIAKIAGLNMCQAYRRQYGCDFISAMPTNLYGPGDNFDPYSSHAVAALVRRTHETKVAGRPLLEVWGSGRPRREFLFIDDCADALVHLMKHYSNELPINIGTGEDMTIRDLIETIAGVIGYRGRFAFDASKPDGTPRKLLNVARLEKLGWRYSTSLEDGLRQMYDWFLDHVAEQPVKVPA
jgi:GDP-L-fucose synthase